MEPSWYQEYLFRWHWTTTKEQLLRGDGKGRLRREIVLGSVRSRSRRTEQEQSARRIGGGREVLGTEQLLVDGLEREVPQVV